MKKIVLDIIIDLYHIRKWPTTS